MNPAFITFINIFSIIFSFAAAIFFFIAAINEKRTFLGLMMIFFAILTASLTVTVIKFTDTTASNPKFWWQPEKVVDF